MILTRGKEQLNTKVVVGFVNGLSMHNQPHVGSMHIDLSLAQLGKQLVVKPCIIKTPRAIIIQPLGILMPSVLNLQTQETLETLINFSYT